MSLSKRINFPDIGHYDTWIIDAMQILYQQNCNVLLFQDWSNELDYIETPVSFETIASHNYGLQDLLDNAIINYDNLHLTKDQKCIAKAMGTTLPFLIVYAFQ